MKITVNFCSIVVLLLVFVSGSPGVYGKQFNYIVILIMILLWVLVKSNYLLNLEPIKEVKYFSVTFILIYISQYLVLGDASWGGLINNILKMLIFSYVIFILKGEFKYVYFNTLFYLSFIGLFFWTLYLFSGFSFDLTGGDFFNSIIIWNNRDDIRNCGPFWEPGAYSGYLMLIPLFFINEPDFFRKHPFKTSILIVGLLTSMSTTGYVAFAIYMLYMSLKSKKRILLVPVFILFSLIVFTKFNFLEEKIGSEFKRAEELKGEYHGQRFAVFLFDLYYIAKHPLIGNGYLETTRYADHPKILQGIRSGELAGHGNGFSNFIASMGLVTFFVYVLLIYFKNKNILKRFDLLFYIAMICILLNGEQFLYYPIFLGLPFFSLKQLESADEKDCYIIDCS